MRQVYAVLLMLMLQCISHTTDGEFVSLCSFHYDHGNFAMNDFSNNVQAYKSSLERMTTLSMRGPAR